MLAEHQLEILNDALTRAQGFGDFMTCADLRGHIRAHNALFDAAVDAGMSPDEADPVAWAVDRVAAGLFARWAETLVASGKAKTPLFTPEERVNRCKVGMAVHNAETSHAMRHYSSRGKNSYFSTFAYLVSWIGYWAASGACNFGLVDSTADMHEARKWCVHLNGGARNVTDAEMFAALVEWRAQRLENDRLRAHLGGIRPNCHEPVEAA